MCNTCASGYYNETSNFCGKKPDNCDNFNSGTKNCVKCDPNFYIHNNLFDCVRNTNPLCSTVDIESKNACNTCITDHIPVDSENEIICKRITPNCNTHNAEKICTACNSGYYLEDNNLCREMTSNCLSTSTGSPKDACTACNTGFHLSGSLGDIKCDSNLEKCLNYSVVPDGCSKCAEDFYLLNNNYCQSKIRHCKETDPDNITDPCKTCEDNYIPKGNPIITECIAEIKDCTS